MRKTACWRSPRICPVSRKSEQREYLDALVRNAGSRIPQVLPVHTEVEGGRFGKDFETILDKASSLGYTIKKLCDIAGELDIEKLPVRGLKIGRVPNRAFKCAV